MQISKKTYLFCGVGGSGMSALAKLMISRGAVIYGSDRNHDAGKFVSHYEDLIKAGVRMVPQDGSGLSDDIDFLVVSSAVEASIPDVKAALEKQIPIIKRAELLAEICNAAPAICVGGTNGKSTVTGMIGWMLHQCGEGPTIINGGGMLNFDRNNAVIGQGARIVAETDESDGTIAFFKADIAILTNIAEDHKNMDELLPLFEQFLNQARVQVLNIDCPNVARLAKSFPKASTYSLSDCPDNLNLIVPGVHNRSNAMAALAVAKTIGMEESEAMAALASFKGITSRLEVVGKKNGITVIDDFGHNPDKIKAGLKTLKESGGRLILMYQPHGFKPTRMHKQALIDVFSQYLSEEDIFYMPEILYIGGTVEKDISSKNITYALDKIGLNAKYYVSKQEIEAEILENMRAGDIVCIMGARDDSLREMARSIFQKIR